MVVDCIDQLRLNLEVEHVRTEHWAVTVSKYVNPEPALKLFRRGNENFVCRHQFCVPHFGLKSD
jgi:hypothetical protein